jgi:hypothetical protein
MQLSKLGAASRAEALAVQHHLASGPGPSLFVAKRDGACVDTRTQGPLEPNTKIRHTEAGSPQRHLPDHDHTHETSPRGRYLLTLALGAVGVVYGDIGTSPLYALRECFHCLHTS